MNIVYLERSEIGALLGRGDRRYVHITKVLRKRAGDTLAAGCSDGTLGEARIESLGPEGLVLAYEGEAQAPALRPLRLLMGFPRPIQAGRILKDLTSLGIAELWFALSELGEKSYAESTFFRDKEYGSHLIEGAEQAGNPRIPEIRSFWSLRRACDELDAIEGAFGGGASAASARLMFHPDADLPRIADLPAFAPPATIAIGSERGWSAGELDFLRERGFTACYLGDRILKTETAAIAAATLVLSRLGYM
jgi:RsmE family RNA methyltransferase